MDWRRRTIVVHTKLGGYMARVSAARAGETGVQIMTMGQLAARLAGGLLQPVDPDALRDAIRDSIPAVPLGELEAIKSLPGMVRAATASLDKAWAAGIELSARAHPRLRALAALEAEVLRRLPPSMKRPADLVVLACERLRFARAVLGPVEIRGHSEMAPCWRPLLARLAETVPVTWIAGPRYVPDWLETMAVEVRRGPASGAVARVESCANPLHEALEAFRWIRALLAEGVDAAEIAIAAASPAELDDHILALSRDANIPVHFVHGVKALTTRDGQAAAALADVLVNGLSQQRVRRLFALVQASAPALRGVPEGWMRMLPPDAPLTTLERWRHVFDRTESAGWPDGTDASETVLDALTVLAGGPDKAAEAGPLFLTGIARALWRRALEDGPAAALPVTLGQLRIEDRVEPAPNVIWASAVALASEPRAHVRLLGLNAGRWPRRITEDRLIPDHVLPLDELDPLPVSSGDRRDFDTILKTCTAATISFSRRDVEGRLLGRSPLISGSADEYRGRARIPEHAASETDRLFARPAEFAQMPAAVSALACWRNWYRAEATAHDGVIGRAHPRLAKLLDQPLSATSLKLLLRDPIRFVWRYGLGWKQPEESDDPLVVDGLAFGILVHDLLRGAVDGLEAEGGMAGAARERIEQAIDAALDATAAEWEAQQPVPPAVIWRQARERTRSTCLAALLYPIEAWQGQRSWTEIPFGSEREADGRNAPWPANAPVEIPGTGIRIQGQIDRLDLSGDGGSARVLDYKTGKLDRKLAEGALRGGAELQRCLYAFAVRTLLGEQVRIEAALLYPAAQQGEQALFPLADLPGALDTLTRGIGLARAALLAGTAVPGIDAGDEYNDFAFAFPAHPGYLARKEEAGRALLGDLVAFWGEP